MMRRTVLIVVWALAFVGLLLAGAFALAQTGFGQRVIAAQLSRALSDAGTTVEVRGLGGLIPFDFRIEQVRLADGEGTWLELDQFRLSASPRALLHGRLEVDEVGAQRLALHRLPPGEDPEVPPADEAEEVAETAPLPELPSSLPPVSVRSLAIERLEVGEAVLGEDAVFRLSGSFVTDDAGEVADLALDLQRTDEDSAHAALEGRIDLAGRTLALDLRAAETGGLLARLTGRPEAGDFRLELSGEGPLDAWAGDLRIDAEGLAQAQAQIGLALADAARLSLDGQIRPAPGVLPAPAEALLGERLQLALTATRPGPQRLVIEDLRATAALASLRGSGRLDGEAERVVANAALQIDDLAPLGRALEVPLAGSLQLDADADGPLLRPEGRLRLAATDLAAAEVAVAELQTTLDLAMLDRLDRRGAMVQVVAEGTARALRLPGEVALPPQDVAWQGELRAPVDRVGTATLERLAVSAGHLRLAAEGTFDASTLGGEARLELALDALAPLAEAYGQAITGSAALEGNLELSADAEVVSIDLYGRASELGGLPQGVGELIGAAPTLEANAVVAPDEGIEVTHLRVAGSAVTLDGRLDLTLPEQGLDGALTLDLPSLAPLTPLVGVDLDGPLTVHAQLGGALAEPSVELTAQSPGLLVDGEHVDALGLIGQLEGTPEQAGGRLGLALTVRGMEAELASAFELRGRTLRLSDVSARAPATRLDGALTIDLERQLVDGELRGRIDQLQAFAPLLPVPLAGELDLEARASAQDGAQSVTLALHGSDLAGDFGRLRELGVEATMNDALGTPRITADLTLRDFAQAEVGLAEGTARAEGTLAELRITAAARGEAHVPYDLSGRIDVTLEEPVQLRVEELAGRVADEPLSLAGPATVTLAAGAFALDDLSLRLGDAQLSGGFALGPQRVAAEARLERLPLEMLGRFGGPELHGQVAGRLSLRGAPDDPSGTIELDATGVAIAAPAFADVPSAELALSGTLEARRLRLDLRGEGVTERPIVANAELPLVVDLAAGAFEIPGEGELAGRLDGEIALARLADILGLDDQRLEGPLRADVAVRGTVAEPVIEGTVRTENALYENGTTGTVLRDIDLLISADHRTVAIERFSATDGGEGRLTGEGTVELDPAADYPVDLHLTVQRARLVIRDDVTATASGDLALGGSAMAPVLSGTVTIDRAEIVIPDRVGPSIAVIPVQEIGRDVTDGAAGKGDGAASAFTVGLDLTVTVPGQTFVRGRGLDSEWEGALQVEGTTAEPRITGALQVRRGAFELLGQRFDLRGGTIEFTGATPPNPVLDIQAVTQAADITAVVAITGEAMSPQFQLTSEPSLPEDEIVSRLLFRRAAGRLGPGDALRLAAAINTLRGGGLGLLGEARQALGLDTLEISGEGLADAEVRAGRYLNDRVFVEVGTGAAANSEDVRVEIEILPSLSLDVDTNAQSQSGVGLRWRFDY